MLTTTSGASLAPLSLACASIRRSILSTVVANNKNNNGSSTSSSSSTATTNGETVVGESPLVIIAGVDSETNPLHEAVIKYLALGSPDVHEPTLQPAFAQLDDSVLFLTQRSATLINTLVDSTSSSDTLLSSSLHALATLRGIQVHRVSSKEREGDGEVAELFKLLSFVDIASRYSGIPLSIPLAAEIREDGKEKGRTNNKTTSKSRAENVEFWPLVQGYALQDIGPGGFFTMRHKINDVGPALSSVLRHIDAHDLKRIMWVGGRMLMKQWKGFEAVVSQLRNTGRRANVLTCEAISEPFVSFYEFASMKSSTTGGAIKDEKHSSNSKEESGDDEKKMTMGGRSSSSSSSSFLRRGAKVLVGRFTELIAKDENAEGGNDSTNSKNNGSDLKLSECGYQGGAGSGGAVHAIAEADDPSTGLRVCRTVSFAAARPGIASSIGSADGTAATATIAGGGGVDDANNSSAVCSLMGLYSILATSFREGLRSCACSSTILNTVDDASACKVISDTLRTSIVNAITAANTSSMCATINENDIIVGCDAMDATGASTLTTTTTAQSNGFRHRRIYYAKAAIKGIKQTLSSESLGSIAIGDSFVILSPSPYVPASPLSIADNELRPILLTTTDGNTLVNFRAKVRKPSLSLTTTAGPNNLPFIRILTAHIPLSHVWIASSGYEGKTLHLLNETISSVSTAAAVNATKARFDAFAVGKYGGGVGSRGIASNSNGDGGTDGVFTPRTEAEHAAAEMSAVQQQKSSTSGSKTVDAPAPPSLETLVTSLGALRPSGVFHNVTLLTGGSVNSIITGTLRVYEKGFILASPAVGPLVISMEHHIDASSLEASSSLSSGTRHSGMYLLLGNEIVTSQANVPARTSDALKQARSAWVDAGNTIGSSSTADTVMELAKAMVEVSSIITTTSTTSTTASASTASSASASATSSTSTSGAAADAALSSPPDVLIMRTKAASELPPCYAFAGIPSSSTPALANGRWLGLILPAESEMRIYLLDFLNDWRSIAQESSNANSNAEESPPSSTSSVTAAIVSEEMAVIEAGLLPVSFLPSYLRVCPYAWAWTCAWDDCHALECVLHADADATCLADATDSSLSLSSSLGATTKPSSIPVYIISGAAGSGSSSFGAAWASTFQAAASKISGEVILVDFSTSAMMTSEGASSSGAVFSSLVHSKLEDALRHCIPQSLSSSSSSVAVAAALPPTVLLVAPYHSDPVDIAESILTFSPSQEQQQQQQTTLFMVAGCITVLDPRHLFCDARRTQYLPRISESMSPGWCQAVVIVSQSGSTSLTEEESAAEKALLAPARAANPALVITRMSLSSTSTLLLPTAQALLRDVASAWVHPRAEALRHITVPDWSKNINQKKIKRQQQQKQQQLMMTTKKETQSNDSILHIYAPEESNHAGGATISGEGSTPLSRVLSFRPVPASSTVSFPVPQALDEASFQIFLHKLVTPFVDRPAAACLAEQASSHAAEKGNAAGSHDATYSLPGIRVNVGNGHAYITVWHVTGIVCIAVPAAPSFFPSTPVPGADGMITTTTAAVTSSTSSSSSSSSSGDSTIGGVSNAAAGSSTDIDPDDDGEEGDGEEGEGDSQQEQQFSPTSQSSVVAMVSPPAVAATTTSVPAAPYVAPPPPLPVYYKVDATPHAIRLTPVGASAVVSSTTISTLAFPFLQITGVGVKEAEVSTGLCAAVVACRPLLPLPMEEKLVSTLLPRELTAIVRLHAFECLPGDITYDGAGGYFDMEGNMLPNGHPATLQFAARHVAIHNAGVHIWNRLVSAAANAAAAELSSSTNDESAAKSATTSPSIITWPTEKDETDVSQGIEVASAAILSSSGLAPPILLLPPPVSAPWWQQIERVKAWLKDIPMASSALRLA